MEQLVSQFWNVQYIILVIIHVLWVIILITNKISIRNNVDSLYIVIIVIHLHLWVTLKKL